MTTLLDHALKYHAKGLAVVPIGNGGKAPVVSDWQAKRLTADELTYHFSNGYNVTGIGIITGELSGNLCILDFDGEGWPAAFEQFTDEWNDILRYAPIVQTGSGKRHIYVKIPNLPGDFSNQKFKRDNAVIELRGNRSNNLAPPSLHPSGNYYHWLTDDADLPEIDFTQLHGWLAGWGTVTDATPAPGTGPNIQRAPLPRRTLEFLANPGRLPEGDRNERLYGVAQQFYAAGYALDEAITILGPVALRIGLTEKEIAPTIKSAYDGAQKGEFEPIRKAVPTHDVLRDRWLTNELLTIYGLGDWRQYQGGLWKPVSEIEIRAKIAGVVEAAKPEGIKPTSAIISSVCDLAKYKVFKPDEIFDADPNYLVCGNGTLHIPTKTLGTHRPDLYATSGVSFDYHPEAAAPAWCAFLFDLTVNVSQAVADFLQEFAGYALTIDTSLELAVWLYGEPGSGKSTFLTGLEAMLGDRVGLLGLADIERSRFALTNIPGKTLAIATEQPGDYIASTNILNNIISGETVTVDRKFREPIDIRPRVKLAWAMNELPRVSDPNSGIFRRVKVVKFPVIPEEQRDPDLKERIKTEGAGILNWALDGLERLHQRGYFEIPAAVTDATEDFKAKNDIPKQFVEECCVTGTDANTEPYRVQSSRLYQAYKSWCIETGHKPQSSTKVADDWRRLKFERIRPGGVSYWLYVGLRADV